MGKVSKEDLEKLIENVVSERRLPRVYDVTGSADAKKSSLDLPYRPAPNYSDLEKLVGKDNDPGNLSRQDVSSAYNRKNKDAALRAAEFIRQNTTDQDFKDEIDAIFKGSEYGKMLKAKQDANLFDFDLDPNNEKKVVRSGRNIGKLKYLADLVEDEAEDKAKRRKALTALVDLVTTKLVGISLVQDILGSESSLAKLLIQKFKGSSLAKERLPAKAPKDEPAMTISDPAISTGGSDQARYRSELISVFSSISRAATVGPDPLRGTSFWTNSLSLISDFSSFVNSGDTDNERLKNLSATEYLSLTIGLDYCYRFAKEIEGGGGAYQFEAFLGLLSNGYVGGKEPGIAGGPGEADFVFQTKNERGQLVPAMGSAKYYASTGASQSARSFELNTPVVYVYAMKRDSGGATTSDAKKIVKIQNHIFTIEKVYGKGIVPQQKFEPLQEGSGGTAKFLGKEFDAATDGEKVKDGQVVFKFTNTTKETVIGYYSTSALGQIALSPGVIEETIAGTLEVPLLDRNSLVQAHQAASKKVDDQVNLAFNSFKDLFKNLIQAKKKATEYSTSANRDTGMEALAAIKSSKSDLINLSTQIAKPGDQVSDNAQLQEKTKITADHLKKLIEESFKK